MSQRSACLPTLLAAVTVALAACVNVDTFFFAARPIDGYRFDEADPAMDGDLSAPHPSLVPAELREEGFAITARGDEVHWILARQPEGRARTTIFFSHGNGPHLGHFWDRVEILWQLGYQVILYDYPGFGRSTGAASEPSMYEGAVAVLALLVARADVDSSRVVLYGHSLGGAPTYEVAARSMRGELGPFTPRAVVSESAWCSMAEMIQDAAFLDLPRELLSHLRFDNCGNLAMLHGVPVMLLHGTLDRVVPIRQLQLLGISAQESPTVHVVSGASHGDISVTGAPWPGSALSPRPSADYATWMRELASPD